MENERTAMRKQDNVNRSLQIVSPFAASRAEVAVHEQMSTIRGRLALQRLQSEASALWCADRERPAQMLGVAEAEALRATSRGCPAVAVAGAVESD